MKYSIVAKFSWFLQNLENKLWILKLVLHWSPLWTRINIFPQESCLRICDLIQNWCLTYWGICLCACGGFRVRKFYGSRAWNCWKRGYGLCWELKGVLMNYLMPIWQKKVCGGFKFLIGTRKVFIWSCIEEGKEINTWCTMYRGCMNNTSE